MPKKFLIISCFLAIQFLIYQPSVYALSKVTDVRYWTAPDHTRIVIDSDQPLSFTTMQLKDPLRFVVNVKGARNNISPAKIEIGDKVAKRVRVGQFNSDTVRIVIDLVKPINAEVFALRKHLDKLDRLVIDLERFDLTQEAKKERLQQKSKEKVIH